MLEEFEKYTNNYDMNDVNIKLKYDHSYRVMNLSRKYANLLGFSTKDVELAALIGLLHDIGRFEQLRVYHSYNDRKTIDHADYSVVQLFDKNQIEKFTKNEQDYEIIKFAIKNHNKYMLPEIDDERAIMHAKLIRDTDKIDILYLLGMLKELNQKADDTPLSKEVIDCIRNHETVDRKYAVSKNDCIAIQFAFVFDIYNDACLEEIKTNIKYFYKQIGKEEIFKEIYEIINNYIDERIDNNVRN
jgi:hypothetical protein